jgi:Spy/CpxP family protein refolding chaperone
MKSVRTLVALLALAAIAFGAWLSVANSKAEEEKKDPPTSKGQRRPGWGQLGLSTEQVQKVYQVQTAYKTRIETLEAQVRALKDEQLAKELDVLTDGQKARLKELDAAKDPAKP